MRISKKKDSLEQSKVYKSHPIDKVNFALKVGNRKHYLQLHLFSRKSIVMVSFMCQKTVCINFFTDHCAQNFFFTSESMCFHSMNCLFNSSLLWKTLETCFSVHVTHSSVNFIWFTFLSHQKFHDIPLFKSEA